MPTESFFKYPCVLLVHLISMLKHIVYSSVYLMNSTAMLFLPGHLLNNEPLTTWYIHSVCVSNGWEQWNSRSCSELVSRVMATAVAKGAAKDVLNFNACWSSRSRSCIGQFRHCGPKLILWNWRFIVNFVFLLNIVQKCDYLL